MHLRYTRATAARRITAARSAAQYPEALEMLRSGEINITTLSMISDILDPDNHAKMLAEIRHLSTRQVEMLVSRHRPVPVIRDTVQPVCARRRVEMPPAAPEAGPSPENGVQNSSPTEDTGSRKCNKISSSAETKSGGAAAAAGGGCRETGGDSGSSAETSNSLKGRVIIEQRLKLGFSVSPEFMINYNKIKALLSNTHPEGIDFETLFEHLMNEYLEKLDPDKKRTRRIQRAAARGREPEERSSRKAMTTKRSDAGMGTRCGAGVAIDRRSRRIPPAIRDLVCARDKGRCVCIGVNGKRCNSTWNLEIDHIVPYVRGGDNSPENLRLPCRKHNMHQAERIYGTEFMKNRLIKK